ERFVAAERTPGAGRSVATDGDVDDPRTALRDLGRRQPPALNRAGSPGLNEHVRIPQERVELRPVARLVEVDERGTLPDLGIQGKRRAISDLRGADVQYLGALLRERARRDGSCDH